MACIEPGRGSQGQLPPEDNGASLARVWAGADERARQPPPIPAWARTLVRCLDDAVRIPGTRITVGLDPLLGLLLPVWGDAATGWVSLAILLLAWRRRVPAVTMARMVLNIALDALVGAIPVAGDLFDVAWRANRKNLELVEQSQRDPAAKATLSDYAVVTVSLAVTSLALLLPLLVGLFYSWLLISLFAR